MNIYMKKDFSKRNNSTKRLSDPDEFDCVLKEPTSLMRPTVTVRGVSFTENYTAAFMAGRYYFIDDIIAVTNDIVEISMHIDVLATYRTQIFNSTQFVERSRTSYNKFITDPLATIVPGNVTTQSAAAAAFSGFDALTGCYLLTVCGGNADAVNFGVTTYVCTTEMIKNVLNFMFNADNFAEQLTDGTVKTFFNPFQYILSVRWLPLSYSTVSTGSGQAQPITIGWWQSDVSAPLVNGGGTSFSYSIDISKLTWRDDFRDFSPGMAYYHIDLPCIGDVTISNSDVYYAYMNSKTIRADYLVDYASGNVDIKLYASGAFIAQYSGSLSVDMQISQLYNDVVGKTINTASAAASLGTSIATMGMGGSFTGASGIWDGIKSINQPTPSTTGSAGNRAEYIVHPYPVFYATFADVVYDPSNYAVVAGRPRMQTRHLTGLSGYVVCKNATIDIPGTSAERAEIEGYLNTGVYLE